MGQHDVNETQSQATTTMPRPPSLAQASLRVFDLSLNQMLWSKRTIFMGLVVGGPVIIALLVRIVDALGFGSIQAEGVRMSGPVVFGLLVWVLYLRFAVPALAVFYGTSLIADEIEDKTITYLFTRPVRRGAVLIGKYLAYLTCTAMVVLPSIMLVFFLIVPRAGGSFAAGFPALVKDLAILALGLAVYGALFAFVGAWFKRPVLTGLVFAFGWEQLALLLPGYLKRFTVAYYLQALVPHAIPQEGITSVLQSLFQEAPSLWGSLLSLALIAVTSLALAMRAVERHEYVLEQ
jgi:ABC-type transport system involved in multi-copper enzyme maturation permease subunit